MKILHIINDYNHGVYRNLIDGLNETIHNSIFIFNRNHKNFNPKFECPVHKKLVNRLYYSALRFFIPLKNRLIANSLKTILENNNFNLIHSHTMFSGGGAAFILRNRINYIVTIRSSDINYVWKYYPWLRSYGINILLHANKIICVAPWQCQSIYDYCSSDQRKILKNKINIIPSGIDSFWYKKSTLVPKIKKSCEKNILYLGEISFNKNIHTLMRIIRRMNSVDYRCKLTIVGGTQDKFTNFVYSYYLRCYNYLFSCDSNFVGAIEDKDHLKQYYRDADIYVMISKRETFGLTYIESISQGTPIIYTKGQGVDGFFENNKVGLGVYLFNDAQIINGIKKVLNNYDTFSKNCFYEIDKFKWKNIIPRYSSLYSD